MQDVSDCKCAIQHWLRSEWGEYGSLEGQRRIYLFIFQLIWEKRTVFSPVFVTWKLMEEKCFFMWETGWKQTNKKNLRQFSEKNIRQKNIQKLFWDKKSLHVRNRVNDFFPICENVKTWKGFARIMFLILLKNKKQFQRKNIFQSV